MSNMPRLLGSCPGDVSLARLLLVYSLYGAQPSASDRQEDAQMVHLGTPGARLSSASADKVGTTPPSSDRLTIQA